MSVVSWRHSFDPYGCLFLVLVVMKLGGRGGGQVGGLEPLKMNIYWIHIPPLTLGTEILFAHDWFGKAFSLIIFLDIISSLDHACHTSITNISINFLKIQTFSFRNSI